MFGTVITSFVFPNRYPVLPHQKRLPGTAKRMLRIVRVNQNPPAGLPPSRSIVLSTISWFFISRFDSGSSMISRLVFRYNAFSISTFCCTPRPDRQFLHPPEYQTHTALKGPPLPACICHNRSRRGHCQVRYSPSPCARLQGKNAAVSWKYPGHGVPWRADLLFLSIHEYLSLVRL